MVATKGDGWVLAPSLVVLMNEVDARNPKRKKTSDGSIGDASHQASKSEHNPDRDDDPLPRGIVSAVDITKDSAAQMEAIRKTVIADPRCWYWIHDGRIWSRTNDFKPRPYTGSNPHEGHGHLSLMQTRQAALDTSSWGVAKAPAPPAPKPKPEPKIPPTLKRGDKSELVAVLQRFLGVRPDSGHFGPITAKAVRRYQREQKIEDDGVVGRNTWTRILTTLKLPGFNA